MIVYVSIGNSDDKLTQGEWAHFYAIVDSRIREYAHVIHGAWTSDPVAPWQNACWCFEPFGGDTWAKLRAALAVEAGAFRQDSIAWAEAIGTEFIGAAHLPAAHPAQAFDGGVDGG